MRRFVLAALLFVTVIAVHETGIRTARAQVPPPGTFASAPVYSATGDATVVYLGGTVAQLEAAARAVRAAGVWVQDANGSFNLLVIGGPSFVNSSFFLRFPSGVPAGAVTLRRVALVDDFYPQFFGYASPDVLFVMRSRLNALSANTALQVVSLTRPSLDHIAARGANVTYLGSVGTRIYYADEPTSEGIPVLSEDGARAGATVVGTVPSTRLNEGRISPSGNAVGYTGVGTGVGVRVYDFATREVRLIVAAESGRLNLFAGWSRDGRSVIDAEVRSILRTSWWRSDLSPGGTREQLPARLASPSVQSSMVCLASVAATLPLTVTEYLLFDLSTGRQQAIPAAPTSASYDRTDLGTCLPSPQGAVAVVLGAQKFGGRALWLLDADGTTLVSPQVVELEPRRWLPDGSGVVASYSWREGDETGSVHHHYFLVRRGGSIARLSLPDAELVDILPAS